MIIKQFFHKLCKNKKLLILWVISIFLIFSICFTLLFFHLVPEAKYRVKTFFGGIFVSAKLKPCKGEETAEFTLEALENDERVAFNQALMLVNGDNPLEEGFEANVGEYKDSTVYMNECLFDAYASLSAAISEKFDTKLYIKSSYRTKEEQQEEYEESPTIAAKVGCSEHQTGLALDVYVPYHAGYAFIESDAGQYTASDGWRYGFIIRYQYYNTDETNMAYEPWHIRYVGFPHAEIITKGQLSLEKYIESMKIGELYEYKDYIITRQKAGEKLVLPKDFESAAISPDNCGNYIITLRCSGK